MQLFLFLCSRSRVVEYSADLGSPDAQARSEAREDTVHLAGQGLGLPELQASETDALALQRRCLQRLTNLGVAPGIKLPRLLDLLSQQEGRPINIQQHGKNGYLLNAPTHVSGMVDRRPERADIRIFTADPPRSARGTHERNHELGHLVVAPGGPSFTSHLRTSAPDSALASSYRQYRCGCEDEEEREVEMTAHLLQHCLTSRLPLDGQPAKSQLGSVLARRGSRSGLR